MRALGFQEHGEIDRFKLLDIPRPEPGPGEVLVRIKASSLNHLDIWVCKGWPGLKLKLPHVCGSDGAGVVAALGEGVSSPAVGERVAPTVGERVAPTVGDRVAIDPGINRFEDEYTERGEHSVSPGFVILGEHVPGTHAEYAVVPAKNLIPIPEAISFEQAAAAGLVYLTAWRMLMRRARIKEGQSVLIIGAGGGVNSASIQLAKYVGCKVYATTSSAEKAKRARELGADEVINYREDPEWAETVYKMTDKRGVDCVVDNVGKATLADSLRAVARGGKIVIVGNTSGPLVQLDIRYIFTKQVHIIGSTMGNHDDYCQAMALVFEGKVKPVIDRVLPLEQGVEAVKIMERGEKFGKIVLTP
ncbi:MAG: zinc-binding dehydrogenase [Planctomycetota bacterium]|jgi:NADPH2:quinone reductase